jgi:hypothetical protein
MKSEGDAVEDLGAVIAEDHFVEANDGFRQM